MLTWQRRAHDGMDGEILYGFIRVLCLTPGRLSSVNRVCCLCEKAEMRISVIVVSCPSSGCHFIVCQFYWREYNDALIVCDRLMGWLTSGWWFIVLFLFLTETIHRHMQQYEVEYLQFAFRWMNNLLMRELPLRCTIRLWDTYQVKETLNSLWCGQLHK